MFGQTATAPVLDSAKARLQCAASECRLVGILPSPVVTVEHLRMRHLLPHGLSLRNNRIASRGIDHPRSKKPTPVDRAGYDVTNRHSQSSSNR